MDDTGKGQVKMRQDKVPSSIHSCISHLADYLATSLPGLSACLIFDASYTGSRLARGYHEGCQYVGGLGTNIRFIDICFYSIVLISSSSSSST
jgi:hypothetical protein